MALVGSLGATPVRDDEELYRSVPYDKEYYKVEAGGIRISSQAFMDERLEPSVDRATVCGGDPRWSQEDDRDGVLLLVTREVRSISTSIPYTIDVIPKPLEENEAHATITPTPSYASKSVFRKVREALAFLATNRGWLIVPERLRTH